MGLILKEKIKEPCAWLGADIANDTSWSYVLGNEHVSAINDALASAKGAAFPHLTRDDFPINAALSQLLANMSNEMEHGKGFVILRGLPIEQYNDSEIETLYYGLGLHLGEPVCQNPKGDLLGKVMNVGDITKKETRVYETNAYLPYHADLSDVFGLICVRKAKSGGLNSLVSSAAVYNEILERYPEYLGVYYRPMYYAHLGEGPWAKAPIFSYHNGKLSCRYLRQYIELGHEMQDRPMSRVEVEALDIFDSITHDQKTKLDIMLEPGDMMFANNYAVLHSRTSFEDFDDPKQRRKLLRLWVKMPNARKLAPDFPGQNGFPPPIATAAGCKQ